MDRAIDSVCAKFASGDANQRATMTHGATGDDLYELLVFARRASVFALREREETWIRYGLTAVAMVDAARIDPRDIPLTLSLVHHASERLQLQTVALFDATSPRRFAGFPRAPAGDKDIAASWGYREIDGEARQRRRRQRV